MQQVRKIKVETRVSRYEHIRKVNDLDNYAQLIKKRLAERIAEKIENDLIINVREDEETGEIVYNTNVNVDYGISLDY